MTAMLQTKEGNPAKSVTSMEFEQWIGQLWKKLHTVAYQIKKPPDVSYQLAFDNAGVHKGANLRQFGLTQADIVYVPSLSCDLQKVVEHCHANLYHAMQRWLAQPEVDSRPKLDVEECKTKLRTAFSKLSDGIKKDVKSLKDTYREIIAKQGHYVSKRRR